MARKYSCDKCDTNLKSEEEVVEAHFGDESYDFCNICWGEYQTAKEPMEERFRKERLEFFKKWLEAK